MKIQRYTDYTLQNEMAEEFLNSFDKMVKESDGDTSYQKVAKKVISDLKLNVSLVTTFGAGIGALYPVVQGLMENMNLDSFILTPESIVLLTLSSVTIAYLQEKKFKSAEEEDQLTKDSKSMLEELKMKGFGNGIVKKLIKSLESVKNIFLVIGKHIGAVIGSILDMFAYTSMFIPIMNGILYLIGKYDFNLETLPQNFIGLGVGVGTIIAKHGIIELVKKIKNKLGLGDKVAKEVVDEVETPIIQKFGDMTYGDATSTENGDLIKEQ